MARPGNKLLHRYVLALVIISVLSIASFFLMHNLISGQAQNAAVMNISGRQRMLSQKTALLALGLIEQVEASSRQRYRRELIEAAELMERSHRLLVTRKSGFYAPSDARIKLQGLYFGSGTDLDRRVNRYLDAARSLAGAPASELKRDNPDLRYLISNSSRLLSSLDLAVGVYQKESEAGIRLLQFAVTAVVVSTQIGLILIGLLIFRPTARLVAREKRQLEEMNAQLEDLSSRDGLTGVANRRALDRFLEREWRRALREKTELASIMIDIDFFKDFNDSYGHQAGDDCLGAVAKAISDSLKRPTDLVARYGGEEFFVALPSTGLKGAADLAEELRGSVAGLSIPHEKSPIDGKVTISLGVAAASPDRGSCLADLIAAADKALYAAKSAGRNQVHVFSSANLKEASAGEGARV